MHDAPSEDGHQVRSRALDACEVSWFAPICDGDDAVLTRRDPGYKSSWANASRIVRRADALGFRNALCPSSYQVGQDTWSFVSALAPLTKRINLLAAIRMGEVHPLMLARAVATVDHILRGRLTLNVISSQLPGEDLDSAARYQRAREVVQVLRQCWTRDRVDFAGEFYRFDGLPTAPAKTYQQGGGPLLYFGGYSEPGVQLCAEQCDVYLMWPDTEDKLAGHIANVSRRAAALGRTLDYGLRVHVVVRETEAEARAAAQELMADVDEAAGRELRERALDAKSYGVALQAQLRDASDREGYAEPHLFTGIGRARSGCGAAIVGDPDQVEAKLRRYMALGIRSFILSGYPHLRECERFAELVLPRLRTCSLPEVWGRVPEGEPDTPLGAGPRF